MTQTRWAEEKISKKFIVRPTMHMLYDSNKMDYKDGHRQIYAYYKMVQFIISARDENVEHDTHSPLNSTYP